MVDGTVIKMKDMRRVVGEAIRDATRRFQKEDGFPPYVLQIHEQDNVYITRAAKLRLDAHVDVSQEFRMQFDEWLLAIFGYREKPKLAPDEVRYFARSNKLVIPAGSMRKVERLLWRST